MICESCRRAPAHYHSTHIEEGETRRESHLCAHCWAYSSEGAPAWNCPRCLEPSGSGPGNLILRDSETGDWAYWHGSCAAVCASRWERPEEMTREAPERVQVPSPGQTLVTFEVDDQDEQTLRVLNAETGELEVVTEESLDGKPLCFTAEFCQCELRNRAWDPHRGRCRTCGLYYNDTRYPLGIKVAEALGVCRICREGWASGVLPPLMTHPTCDPEGWANDPNPLQHWGRVSP